MKKPTGIKPTGILKKSSFATFGGGSNTTGTASSSSSSTRKQSILKYCPKSSNTEKRKRKDLETSLSDAALL